ncbi:MAG TPA: presenilin family intramembrane aspartyl protease [Patescibacteria group bacterium]|nr:presenilin family intramembrane aspartyl protease [Patescibacteria group bacterium]
MPSKKLFSGDARSAAAVVMGETLVILAATFALAAAAVRSGVRAVSAGALPSDAALVWTFLAAFAAVTVVLLLMLRTFRGSKLFEAVFLLAVFTGIGTLLYSYFGGSGAVLLTSIAVFLYYGSRSVLVFDLLLVLGCAGIAETLGASMSPVGTAIILTILAAYDIVAVYVTKHMVAMAETLLRRRVFFAMILPERPDGFLLPTAEARPGEGFVFLGTGDVILPALLVVSVSRLSVPAAVITAVGALLGAAALHVLFLSQKVRRPMPALPPIAAGALLGFVASFFLYLS